MIDHRLRRRRPAVVVAKLSADETLLSWHKHGLASKLKHTKELQIEHVSDVHIGRESAAFQRAAPGARGSAHLSLSLVLKPVAAARRRLPCTGASAIRD